MNVSAIEGLLMTAVTTLSGCVVFLFRKLDVASKKCEDEREKCEKDRRELWRHVALLETLAKLPTNADPETLTKIRPKVPGKPDTDHGGIQVSPA